MRDEESEGLQYLSYGIGIGNGIGNGIGIGIGIGIGYRSDIDG